MLFQQNQNLSSKKFKKSKINRRLLTLAAITATGIGLSIASNSYVHADTLVWTGATNGNWDTTSTDFNWNDVSSSTNNVAYTEGSAVEFNGSGTSQTSLTVGSGSGVSPASVDFVSGAGSYSLTNVTGDTAGIAGTTAVTLV